MARIGFLYIWFSFWFCLDATMYVSHCFIAIMFLNHVFLLKFCLGIIWENIIKAQQWPMELKSVLICRLNIDTNPTLPAYGTIKLPLRISIL